MFSTPYFLDIFSASSSLSATPINTVCSRKLVALILQGFSIFQNHVFTSTFPSHFVTFLFCTLSRYYKISHFFLKNY